MAEYRHETASRLLRIARDAGDVVTIAPRYDPRILALVEALDDERESMAETCRRVCNAAERADLTRPSYVHLSRLVRARRDELEAKRVRRRVARQVYAEAAGDVMAGLVLRPAFAVIRHHAADPAAE